MALVFKIKHRGTLRRWVVSPTLPENGSVFPVTVREVEEKVREMFHVATDNELTITYLDKEGDVVTLADDQDLWDACMVQSLNPLRLDVQIDEIKHSTIVNPSAKESSTSADSEPHVYPHVTSPLTSPEDMDGNSNRSSKAPFPQVTADAIKQFLTKYTQTIDPNLQPAIILRNIQKALKDFVKTVVHEGQRLAPRVASAGRSPAYTRCASEPPLRYPSMDSTHPVVHLGVTCDACNSSPIRGVRYKSTKIFNYDLCSDCFAKIGNETDYWKLDKVVSFVGPAFYHPLCSKKPKGPVRWAAPFAAGTDGWKSECPFLRPKSGCPPADESRELDASVVKDLTNFNGDEVSPGMEFQWIVRLKNTGSKPWPQGTKFIHLSGNKLTAKLEVDLKLPASGSPVGLEVEICLDMSAPDTAGNYISHWCLATPSGEQFGKTLWVALQVTPEHHGSSRSSPEVQQLACDEADDGQAGAVEGVSDVERTVEPDDGKAGVVQQVSDVERTVEPAAAPQVDMGMADKQMKKQEVTRVMVEEDIAEKEGSPSLKSGDQAPQLPCPAMVDEEITDLIDEVYGFSVIEKPVEDAGSFSRMMHSPVVSSQLTSSLPTCVIREHHARLSSEEVRAQDMNLRLLDSMGFTNSDLNVVLLEKNNQDLQHTLDDLLLGSGWDNLLKDLVEMGFTDTHTNLRLLIKNEGSLKRVVKELIELEKY